jgi:hypothetical protein
MAKVFFQIGSNNGNDLFRELVLRHQPDIVILVEPNETKSYRRNKKKLCSD